MTMITKEPHPLDSRPPAGSLTPFLAPSAAEDSTLAPRTDRGEQAMQRLRHPFAVRE
jgi:hypothetical protein